MLRKQKIFYLLLLFTCWAPISFSQSVQLENAFPNLTFSQPLFLTHSNDGTNRIFVVQQNGIIYVFPNDSSINVANRKVFLDVSKKISSSGGEQGLLGLAFHPDFAINGYFYINYTASSPLRTIVSRFTIKPSDPSTADSLSEFKILEISQPFSNHNGGMIFFGTDGYIYIGTGDGGSGGDPQNNSQNLKNLLGKILRIDVDTITDGRNYGIPPTNPFYGDTLSGKEEIFAWGLRNPWRFSQDPITGYIIAGDVGQGAWEEVDLIENGKNYGWRCYEGNATYNTSGCGDRSNYTFPLITYPNPGSGCSVTGGYIYRGSRRPDLYGDYIYADFCNGNIRKFRYENGIVTGDTVILDSPFSISSFGIDENNELYICDYSGGTIQRFRSTNANSIEDIKNDRQINILEQNYPNPFNPSTKITFQIKKTELVELSIYNILGEKLTTLLNRMLTPGVYTLPWEPRDMPAGIYLYRIKTETFTDTKIMAYIK